MRERADSRLPLPVFLLLIAGALLVGLRLRTPGSPASVINNTVSNYYFDKTQRLAQDGAFPRHETLRFAPGSLPENAPPGLAYATVWAHGAAALLLPDLPLRASANAFPLLIFALWLACVAALLADLVSPRAAAAAAVALCVAPASLELTRYGSYFEEVPGNFLLFASACLLVKALEETGWRWTALAALATTALDLTWQQFPILYGAAALLLLFEVGSEGAGRRAFRVLLALGLPLLAGDLLGRVLLGTGYSPLSMLGEAVLGTWRAHDPDLRIAMTRRDWTPVSLRGTVTFLGWLGAGLTALGGLAAAASWSDRRKRGFLVFGALGLLLLAKFMKERFLALALCLPLMALGAEILLDPGSFAERCRKVAAEARRRWSAFFPAPLRLGALAAALLVCAVWVVLRRLPPAPPKPALRISGLGSLGPGRSGIVEVTLKNSGGRAPLDENAFAGLHVEVENGAVHDIRAETAGRPNRIIFKAFAQTGNTFFFEVKDPRLEPGETMRARFRVEPDQTPVRVFARGWVPGPCTRRQRKEAVKGLLQRWKNVRRSGWRNEDCIRRVPANGNDEAPLCRVEVFAAHKRLQAMRCLSASARSR